MVILVTLDYPANIHYRKKNGHPWGKMSTLGEMDSSHLKGTGCLVENRKVLIGTLIRSHLIGMAIVSNWDFKRNAQ